MVQAFLDKLLFVLCANLILFFFYLIPLVVVVVPFIYHNSFNGSSQLF